MARNKRKQGPSSRQQAQWYQNRFLWIGVAVLVLAVAVWVPTRGKHGGLPQEGQPIADFSLTDSAGNPFRLSDAYRDHDLILVFYRGFG